MTDEERSRQQIAELRAIIGHLDIVLRDILSRRAWVVREIQREKRRLGLPVRDPSREAEVFHSMSLGLRGDKFTYPEEVVRKVFADLMAASEDIAEEEGR